MGKKKNKPRSDKSGDTARDVLVSLERLHRFMRAACHAEGLNPAQWDTLRYLSRCNQFSNSPSAVSHYLGTTRGTISQTLLSLEKRGLVRKVAGTDGHRSVALHLTELAIPLLDHDPLLRFAKDVEQLGGKTRRKFGKGVKAMLRVEIERQGGSHFGSCLRCRHYTPPSQVEPIPQATDPAAPASTSPSSGPDSGSCSYFQVKLTADDIIAICRMHQRG